MLGSVLFLEVCLHSDALAVSIREIVAKLAPLQPAEREALLREEAKKEGQIMLYGSLLAEAVPIVQKAFSADHPSVTLENYRGIKETILNRVQTEARAGKYNADVIQVDLSYGLSLIKANLVAPHSLADTSRYFRGTFDEKGYWHTIFIQTTALAYNRKAVRPDQVPRTYQDLLHPKWKGKMVFDPEAGYILAAMQDGWGRDKALSYLGELSRQNIHFVRSQGLTTQLVSAGEYDIAIALNGQSAAEVREKGAPLGFAVLAPKIFKPSAVLLAANAPHPYSAILFLQWVLSERGQKVFANLGRGVAMKGIEVRHKEFQIEPDYVVGLEYGAALTRYLDEFHEIFGLPRTRK